MANYLRATAQSGKTCTDCCQGPRAPKVGLIPVGEWTYVPSDSRQERWTKKLGAGQRLNRLLEITEGFSQFFVRGIISNNLVEHFGNKFSKGRGGPQLGIVVDLAHSWDRDDLPDFPGPNVLRAVKNVVGERLVFVCIVTGTSLATGTVRGAHVVPYSESSVATLVVILELGKFFCSGQKFDLHPGLSVNRRPELKMDWLRTQSPHSRTERWR
jgi:hypothetical protein